MEINIPESVVKYRRQLSALLIAKNNDKLSIVSIMSSIPEERLEEIIKTQASDISDMEASRLELLL